MFYEVLGDEPVTPEKRQAIQDILASNRKYENIIVTSVVTHLEVLPSKLNAKQAESERKYNGMFDGKRFQDIEVNRNILIRAREIREFYYRAAKDGNPAKIMDAADAVHLATATIYNAIEFHTRDDDKKGSKIPLVSLYQWSGVDKICGKYPLLILSPENDQGVLNLAKA